MKTIGAAVFLIFSSHLALASDFDFPTLKYDQREPGSLPSVPALGVKFTRPAFDGSNLEASSSGSASVYGVKMGSLKVAPQKSAPSVSGGVSLSRVLNLTLDPTFDRSMRDYSLISREPLEARAPSKSSNVSP